MAAWVGKVACAFAGMVCVRIHATRLWTPGPATCDLPRAGEANRTSLAPGAKLHAGYHMLSYAPLLTCIVTCNSHQLNIESDAERFLILHV